MSCMMYTIRCIRSRSDIALLLLQEKDLSSPLVADTLNSVMSCGELPTLYTNDEMDGLLQVRL